MLQSDEYLSRSTGIVTDYKRHGKKFWNNGNIYFVWSGGYTGIYISQTHPNVHVKFIHFIAYILIKLILKGKYLINKWYNKKN